VVETLGISFNVFEHYIRTLRSVDFNQLFLLIPNQHLSRKILLAHLTLELLPSILNRIIRMLLSDFTFGPLLQTGKMHILLMAFTITRRDKELIVENSLKTITYCIFETDTTCYIALYIIVLIIFLMFIVKISFTLCMLELS
jgi:hypothetical protein